MMFVAGPGNGDAYWFGSTRMTIKARASTQRTAIVEMCLPIGSSAPLHVHEDLDDSFLILEGRLSVWFDNETTVADPGTYVQLPRGLPHSILASEGPVRALLIHDNDSFIDFIEAVGTPVADASTPPQLSPERVARAAEAHGQRVLGPPPFAVTV